MTQRKLTDEELQVVMDSRFCIRQLAAFACDGVYWQQVQSNLNLMAAHSTTDGRYYIVPIVPPIPDGYRLAVAGDERRADRRYWAESLNQWVPATCMAYRTDVVFIVPADRVPTDEEARSRPEVMVRDCTDTNWTKATLYGVIERAAWYSFLVASATSSGRFKYCRHLYSGE